MKNACEREIAVDQLYYIVILALMLIYTLINKNMEKK